MRIGTALLIAAAITAAPAAAQQTGTTDVNAATDTADPALAGNTVDTSAGATAPVNGLAPASGVPVDTATALPPPPTDPLAADPAATRPARDGRGGFPWGLLGLLGLVGLLGRSRSARGD